MANPNSLSERSDTPSPPAPLPEAERGVLTSRGFVSFRRNCIGKVNRNVGNDKASARGSRLGESLRRSKQFETSGRCRPDREN